MKKKRNTSGTKKQINDVQNEEEALLLIAQLEKEIEINKKELEHSQEWTTYTKARMDDAERRLKELTLIVELSEKPFNAADSYEEK